MAVSTSHTLPWPCMIHSSRERNVILRPCLRDWTCVTLCVYVRKCLCVCMCLCVLVCVRSHTSVCVKQGGAGDEGVEQARPARYRARFRRSQKCNRVCKNSDRIWRKVEDGTFVNKDHILNFVGLNWWFKSNLRCTIWLIQTCHIWVIMHNFWQIKD